MHVHESSEGRESSEIGHRAVGARVEEHDGEDEKSWQEEDRERLNNQDASQPWTAQTSSTRSRRDAGG